MMSIETMTQIINSRIDELLANQSVQEMLMREKANGMNEEGIKNLVHNLAIGTLCFGEKK
ncbi:hypothetical protein [Aeromonas phage AS-yj]|uniref:Uncharacterized protein n=6 Tax=Caudoviricetes TaxID=2731619 RepID=A0A291LEV4_9CAUD|nr:hypothetical protein HWB28_gp119 [Aeromonas phage AS-zj]YP_009835053.1 hypothetical protein HWB29_gp351 [Aeromonas phage AS-sw]ATI17563.1 hypothetical protein [Aeromonas phage AS-szw]ATI17945.1 hypothetical protein [Aeromonas phage AS-yj]QAX98003.1 hypothetical protein ASswx1_363 [Aeromonas phage Asswx_1]QMV28733.1 hypothetical protein AP1_0015 [Aeromonas phage AP1]UKM62630.1 hypothetical protein P19_0142 [Aeromonas phage P19]